MKNFFASPACDWRRPNGSLHLYLIPDDQQRRELSGLQEQLDWPAYHARQPAEFLHATVLRLPWYEPELEASERESLQRAVTHALNDVPPFTLDFDALELTDYGVVMTAPSVAGWHRLVDTLEQGLTDWAVRRASVDARFTRPSRPHVSLSYGREKAGDADLATTVSRLSVQQRWNVQRAELVAVSMHKGRGTYSWELVSTHHLSGDQQGMREA